MKNQNYVNFKQEINNTLPILKIINKYFWKTKIGPIFSIVFPLLLLVVYFAISKSRNDAFALFSGLPTVLSLSILPLLLLTLPSMNIEFRNSIILRKIKIIGISKIKYVLISYLLFSSYSVFFCFFGFFIFCCFLGFDTKYLNDINWGSLIYGIVLLIISGVATGLLLSTAAKTSLSSQLIGFGVLLLTLVFSGQFMPLSVIGEVEALKYISLISPLTYSANIFNVAIYSPLANLANSLPKSLLPLTEGLINPSNSIFNFHSEFILYSTSFSEIIMNGSSEELVEKIIEIISNIHNNPNIGLLLQQILCIKTTVIYEIWQKVLFVVMPFVFTIGFNFLFIYLFKWSGR